MSKRPAISTSRSLRLRVSQTAFSSGVSALAQEKLAAAAGEAAAAFADHAVEPLVERHAHQILARWHIDSMLRAAGLDKEDRSHRTLPYIFVMRTLFSMLAL